MPELTALQTAETSYVSAALNHIFLMTYDVCSPLFASTEFM